MTIFLEGGVGEGGCSLQREGQDCTQMGQKAILQACNISFKSYHKSINKAIFRGGRGRGSFSVKIDAAGDKTPYYSCNW